MPHTISRTERGKDALKVLCVLTAHSIATPEQETDLALTPRVARVTIRRLRAETRLTPGRIQLALQKLEDDGRISPAPKTRVTNRSTNIRIIYFPYTACAITSSSGTPVNS